MQLLFAGLAVGSFLLAPTMLIWGWARWTLQLHSRDNSTMLSFVGFLLATASAAVALSAVAYSLWVGGFQYYDPGLLRVFRLGLLLSLTAVGFSGLGAGRKNLLRWQALGSSLGTLMFWIMSVAGE